MKRVLVASDLTPRSVKALERTLILAKQIGAEVYVVHVVDADLPTTISQQQRQAAEQQLQQWLAESPHAAGVQTHVEIVLGHRVASVLTAAEAKNVELLVLGVHRRSPIREVFVGATSEQIIRLSRCPVLVVADTPAAPYQRMLAAVDFSAKSRQAVEYAAALLPDVALDMLHVYAMSYTGLANLSQNSADNSKLEQHLHNMVANDEQRFLGALKAANIPQQVDIRAGSVLTVIPEEITKRNADLLVVGTHSRRGVARAVLGSVTAKLMQNPVCDLLVVR